MKQTVTVWHGVRLRPFIFFFQAEDGIRAIGVTGVQTCALPISSLRTGSRAASSTRLVAAGHASNVFSAPTRSEERRVGKECRSRWWLNRLKKKRALNRRLNTSSTNRSSITIRDQHCTLTATGD